MSQHTYGSIPTSEGEAEATTLVHRDQDPSELIHDDADSCCPGLRHRLAEILESKCAHMVIVALTIIDILLVMLQIGASLLHLDETNEEVWYLELFEHISLAIVSIFMAEILLKLFTFGPKYFWKGTRLGMLHLADAIIITLSFFLEVFLKNVEARELGSLLIVFRLWRVIKLTGTVAIEVNEQDNLKIKKLEERIKELEQELAESQAQVTRLRQYTEDQA
ncbi:hypothetical protein BGW42_000989 [Actinomortierella wolfii]|nr:hypothetical protein BGW42_000989 [Actinomortierella wolfii]